MNEFLNRFDTPIPLTLGKKVEPAKRDLPFSERPLASLGGLSPRQHAEKNAPVRWVHDSRLPETDQKHPAARAAGLDGSPPSDRPPTLAELINRVFGADAIMPSRAFRRPTPARRSVVRVVDGLVGGQHLPTGLTWGPKFDLEGNCRVVVESPLVVGEVASLAPGDSYQASWDLVIEHDAVPF